MAEDNSLLGFIAQRHTSDLEDVATNALSFILSRSDRVNGRWQTGWGTNAGLCISRKRNPGGPMHMEPSQIWPVSTGMTTWWH